MSEDHKGMLFADMCAQVSCAYAAVFPMCICLANHAVDFLLHLCAVSVGLVLSGAQKSVLYMYACF